MRHGQRSFVLGLVGAGITGSLTPPMQEHEGAACGLNLTYRRIDTELEQLASAHLPAVLTWARRLGFDGLNITHPFKRAVLPLLDELTDEAHHLSAVNTVLLRGHRMIGANTDWSGYGQAFRRALPEAVHDRVVLLGAGGAGSAVGYALLRQGAAQLRVVDADRDRTDDCVTRLAKVFGDERVEAATEVGTALAGAHGLVNATPIGMLGHEGMPLSADLVHPGLWVSDVVYFPLQTQLINLARARGCRVMPGGGMAVFQAAHAFEYFTDRAPDVERMIRHFTELTCQ